MLHGIYAPTDFISADRDPSVTPADKLQIIANSPTTLKQIGRKGYEFVIKLPFVDAAAFFAKPSDTRLFSDHINIGDEALYGHGIGSRLLRSGLRYGVEQQAPNARTFRTGWARLGLVNTVVAVLGEENVGVRLEDGTRFGWQSELALGEMFQAQPPVINEPYVVSAIIAQVNPDLAMSWEAPVHTTSS